MVKSRTTRAQTEEDQVERSVAERLVALGALGRLTKGGLAKLLGMTPSGLSQALRGRKISGAAERCIQLLEILFEKHERDEVLQEVLGEGWVLHTDYGGFTVYDQPPWYEYEDWGTI